MVAIDRRHRAAHDLHALGAIEVEGRRLALAVGHRSRDAVAYQTYTAHSEGSAGAEAARGNLQILSIVLTILDGDTRHRHQRFGNVDPRIVSADAPGIDDINGARQIEAAVFDAAAGDHDRVERRRRRISSGQTRKRGGQNGNDAPGASVHVRLGSLQEQRIGCSAFWPCRAVDRNSARSIARGAWPAFAPGCRERGPPGTHVIFASDFPAAMQVAR